MAEEPEEISAEILHRCSQQVLQELKKPEEGGKRVWRKGGHGLGLVLLQMMPRVKSSSGSVYKSCSMGNAVYIPPYQTSISACQIQSAVCVEEESFHTTFMRFEVFKGNLPEKESSKSVSST
ncbi:unnamed protein product [Ranitomeya imitator]|uniref:Uncharacterized protein n=1 Tax=Ranitomeya imitator TaxID=111125 RepID=A0ABN9L2Q9_9NEOB|nr:unnamed protein product [Ranitomeya imitator]